MCKVSTQLRFCTCSADAISKEAYWTLYRYQADQEMVVIGDLILPYHLDSEIEQFNREVLLARINDPKAWDFVLNPAPKDRLAVTINFKKNGEAEYSTYGFEFDGLAGQWAECEFEPFEWMSKHEEGDSGEVEES